MSALYELTGQYLALVDSLDRMDMDAQTIADTIEASGIVDDIQTKAQNIEMVAREATKYITLIDMEIDRLKELKACRERVGQGLRDYLKRNMGAAQIERIECPFFRISIQKNPPAVDIFDPLSIPADYMTTPKPPAPVPDKERIKEAIKAGQEIPGARLTQSTRLAIK